MPEPSFPCENCSRVVPGAAEGTRQRNHCPYCLHTLHVDIGKGDRRSGCRGIMEPIAVWVKKDGEWAIVHRCRQCGKVNANRVAGDDNEVALLSLALRPLARPAFPLDTVVALRARDRVKIPFPSPGESPGPGPDR